MPQFTSITSHHLLSAPSDRLEWLFSALISTVNVQHWLNMNVSCCNLRPTEEEDARPFKFKGGVETQSQPYVVNPSGKDLSVLEIL
jgi:hypothetical protein